VAIVLAFMAATCFAVGTVLQQKGALSTDAGGDDSRFLVQILREPIWLCGAGTQAAGWVFQGPRSTAARSSWCRRSRR
jgi:hypothetical protein